MQRAAEDFRYLLNRGYPRKASLDLVGNRYQLTSEDRHLLHRGIFSDRESRARAKKKIPLEKIGNKNLAIDGYNVLITIEAGLSGRPLILGDDDFIRDISGLSGNFKKTSTTEEALQQVLNALSLVPPRHTLFLFDAPISMSGTLAQEVREMLIRKDLPGDAQALRVPEKILIGFKGVIATSDTAIIDQSQKVLDLAGDVLKKRGVPESFLHFKRKGGSVGRK